jgi:hypothetical protein
MYCPNCGTETVVGLKYCTKCGGNLGSTSRITGNPMSRISGAAWAVALATVAVVLGGLGITFSFAYELVRRVPNTPEPGDQIGVSLAMIVLGSATILVSVFLLIRLFSRLLDLSSAKLPRQLSAKPVDETFQPQIQSVPLTVSSITEHTTRNFEPRSYNDAGASK